jgi:hypothetical protein
MSIEVSQSLSYSFDGILVFGEGRIHSGVLALSMRRLSHQAESCTGTEGLGREHVQLDYRMAAARLLTVYIEPDIISLH